MNHKTDKPDYKYLFSLLLNDALAKSKSKLADDIVDKIILFETSQIYLKNSATDLIHSEFIFLDGFAINLDKVINSCYQNMHQQLQSVLNQFNIMEQKPSNSE